MNILVDENIPFMTVQALREMGYDVLDIRGTADEGMTDDVLWETAQRGGRLLITTDRGFARYRRQPHYGILIVCLRQPNRHRIHQRVMQAFGRFSAEEWPDLLVTMRDTIQSVWRAGSI